MGKLTPIFNGKKWEVEQAIPNTMIEPFPQNGVNTKPYALYITPNEGYVLHDKGRDGTALENVVNENGAVNEYGVFKRGYTWGKAGCGINYDFSPIQIELDCGTVTAYGGFKEYCAVPADFVPADQIK